MGAALAEDPNQFPALTQGSAQPPVKPVVGQPHHFIPSFPAQQHLKG